MNMPVWLYMSVCGAVYVVPFMHIYLCGAVHVVKYSSKVHALAFFLCGVVYAHSEILDLASKQYG